MLDCAPNEQAMVLVSITAMSTRHPLPIAHQLSDSQLLITLIQLKHELPSIKSSIQSSNQNFISMGDEEWEIFGSDDEDEENSVTEDQINDNNDINKWMERNADHISIQCIQRFIKTDPIIPMSHRYIGLPSFHEEDARSSIIKCIRGKLMQSHLQLMEDDTTSSLRYDIDTAILIREFDISNGSLLLSHSFSESCEKEESTLRRRLALGGSLILTFVVHLRGQVFNMPSSEIMLKLWKTASGEEILSEHVWETEDAQIIYQCSEGGFSVVSIHVVKRPCLVNTLSCKWKSDSKLVPSTFGEQNSNDHKESWLQYERRTLKQATVSPSVYEMKESILTRTNVDRAVKAIQTHGFVILPCMFQNPKQLEIIKMLSNAVLEDFDSAVDILKKKYDIDILNPGEGSDPLSYKEMAMREDFRVDLRDGHSIRKVRKSLEDVDKEALDECGYHCLDGGEGTMPAIIDKKSLSHSVKEKTNIKSLRYNPFILDIIRKLLNPTAETDAINVSHEKKHPLYKGNFGRWNFSGSGPNGSPMPVRVGQIGSVISMKGAADQCVHADTPHIFEIHDCLPCHYANLFILGEDSAKSPQYNVDHDGNFTGESLIGGTAFVDGSHRLSVTARLTADDGISAAGTELGTQNEMHLRTLRPSLQIGDALIFDTRTLHFGLANQSDARRPMLYVNLTHSWFFDPKNWDNKQSIFEDAESEHESKRK